MSTRAATIAVTGARLAAGAVIAVGCVLGVSAAVAAPWPAITGTAAQSTVATIPADARLVCTGAFTAVGRDAQDASALEAEGSSRITVDGDPTDPERTVLDAPDVDGSAGTDVYTAPVEDRTAPLIAAAESQRLAVDDLAGLAASACEQPTTQSWIVGGSIETGAGDVLVLSNPGTVPATVTLDVFGEETGSSSIVIAAQTQTAVPFASVAAGQTDAVVRVTAEGSPVRASLQSSLIDTLDPAGADLQSSTIVVAESLTFAGVQVAALAEGDATDVLRVLSVDADSEAQVIVRAPDGEVAQEFTAPLTAGLPLEVAITDLELGTYSVEVSADSDLVAGIRQSTGTGAGTDFAWMTPAAAIEDDTLFAVPSGPSPTLHLVGDPEQDAIVVLTTLGGAEREVAVPAGTSVLVGLSASTVYRLSTDAAVSAAITMAGTGQLAGWPITPGPSDQDDVTVVH